MGIYTTHAQGFSDQVNVQIKASDKQDLISCPPVEFGGPSDQWSPEDLFCASISSCFILTLKAIAKIKKMEWISLEVTTDAVLEKVEGGLKFTNVTINPVLFISSSHEAAPYLELLQKAKSSCLVTRSMNCNFLLNPKIHLKSS